MLSGDVGGATTADKAAILQYVKDHKIEEMILQYVEELLVKRPEDKTRFWYDIMLKQMKAAKAANEGEAELTESEEEDDGDGEQLDPDDEDESVGWVKDVPGMSLRHLFEATKRITKEIVPKDSITAVIEETINLLKCDRVSVFIYDSKMDMLILSASNLKKPIRVQRGQGIAGDVFERKEIVNIPDCYADSRFDPSFDKVTGYHTRCLIAVPILDYERDSVGVLQAINKNDGVFTERDELMLQHLSQQAGIAYRNAELYGAALKSSERSAGLLKMLSALTQNTGAQSMILQMTIHANELVQADRCTVFMLDTTKEELWSVSTDTGKEIRIPQSKGIAGECCMEGKIINIEDAYQDPRFNPAIDKATGYKTTSILAVPIRAGEGGEEEEGVPVVYGIIQMINKTEFDGQFGAFDDEDINIIETFAQFVGAKLQNSSLFRRKAAKATEGASAFGNANPVRKGKRQSLCTEAHIVEGAEGEEDDSDAEAGSRTESKTVPS